MSTIDRLGQAVGDVTPSVGSSAPSASLAIKTPVRAATTANITLNGLQTVDGVALVADDRALVKDQTDTTQNGIYLVSTGNWTRTVDFDGSSEAVKGTIVFINEGTVNSHSVWGVASSDPIQPGSALTFSQSVTANPIITGTAAFLSSAATSSKFFSASPANLTGYVSTGLFNFGVGIFAGVNAPYSTDPNVVYSFGYNVAAGGGRESSSYPSLKLSFETKFYSATFVRPTQPHLEWHLASGDTTGTERRPLSFALPWDGGTGSLGAINVDLITFSKYDTSLMVAFNFRTTNLIEVQFEKQTTIRVSSNNTPILRQFNAAGTDYLNHWYVDSADELVATQTINIAPAAPAGATNSIFNLLTSGMTDAGYLYRGGWNNNVTGTVNADYIAGQATVEVISNLVNFGAGDATFQVWAFTGDPKIVFNPNAGPSGQWSAGIDNSDGDSFKIAGDHALDSETYLTISVLGNFVIGNAALATSATDGFLYIPTCAGAPTGNSTDYAGLLPMIYDTSNNKLWFNTTGTTWKGVVLA